jgi:uncharacterized protein YdaU (DUF1376 family)
MAVAKIDIWMPIYIGDYLRDTQALTAEEHGVYFLLLMHYWQKKGEIGSDIKRLAMVARSDVETTKNILETFFILTKGQYKNKRADEELKNAKARSDTAKANINKRWNKGSNTDVIPTYNGSNTDANTESIPDGYSSSPSSSLPISLPISAKEREEPKDDFTTRFEKIKSIWNNSGLKPPMRKSTFDLMQDERTAIAGTMRNYSDDDISIAIDNYMQIMISPNHCIENPYRGLVGFIRGGVEKFIKDADPWETFKKKAKGFETAGERDDRLRAEAIARLRGEEITA